ncbi:helix-turn-helix transcriptional regulator [Tabrizicola aquatica]|uniref:helix-turn-helix transcriptional regulator n=1 Tax=Tabrizicola aquatica TaxID=909926 RepID=UPI000CD235E5|nr:AraC family transcriptional regulator [Tabrizicola aquatica]
MKLPSPTSSFRLVAIPRLAAGGRWRVEAMRSLSEPCLLWFTKGQGRITIAGVTRGYTAHNAIFIPAGVMHGFEAGPQVFGTAVFFGRDCDIVLPKTPQHLRIREVHAQQEVNILLDSILRELESDVPAHDRATQHYMGLLGVWLERQARKAEPGEAPKPDATRRLVSRYTTLLERNFRTGMNVGDFAAALGVTPTHLTRCCNAASGRPASALLQDRRIFEARKLLSETKLPVGRIAEQLGFNSAAYFTRAFQHLTGKSPSAFRRSA